MKKRIEHLPMQVRSFGIEQAASDKDSGLFDVVMSSGVSVERTDFFGDRYIESLNLAGMNLDRVNSGSVPLLNTHKARDIENVIGRVVSAEIKDGKLVGQVQIDNEEIAARVRSGVLNAVSIGYNVKRQIVKKGDLPELHAAESELMELSIVPVPADGYATFQRSAEDAAPCEVVEEEPEAEADVEAEATADPEAEVEQEAEVTPAPAPVSERETFAQIVRLATQHGCPEIAADLISEADITVERAEQRILARSEIGRCFDLTKRRCRSLPETLRAEMISVGDVNEARKRLFEYLVAEDAKTDVNPMIHARSEEAPVQKGTGERIKSVWGNYTSAMKAGR